jgi:uncharacterized protein YqgC (DUF456 family)
MVWAAILVLVLVAGFVSTLLGLPGNWIIVAATSLYVFSVPTNSPLSIGWPTVIVLAVLAAVGELVEFLAGALGVAKAGGSRRSATFALAGSFLGSLVGMVVGLPIPIIGPVVAVLLFASVGALVGAVLGEEARRRDPQGSWRVGKAAFWGRLLGTAAKTLAGAVMAAIVVAALILG